MRLQEHRREVGQGGDGRPQLEEPAGHGAGARAPVRALDGQPAQPRTSTTARWSRWTTRRATSSPTSARRTRTPRRATKKFQPRFDVLADGWRQPGSAFKPVVYSTGIANKSITAASMFMDVVTNFGGGYTPTDADNLERGPVRMRDALSFSLNIPAVKAGTVIGNDAVAAQAEAMGIQFQDGQVDAGAAFPLGVEVVHPLDLVRAYGVLGDRGPARRADDDPHRHRQQRRAVVIEESQRPEAGRRARPGRGLHHDRHPGRQHEPPEEPVLGPVRDHRRRRSDARRPSRPAPATRRATSTPTASSPRPTTAVARTASTRWSSGRGTATPTTRSSAAAGDRCSRSTSPPTSGRASWRRPPRAGRSTASWRPTASSGRRSTRGRGSRRPAATPSRSCSCRAPRRRACPPDARCGEAVLDDRRVRGRARVVDGGQPRLARPGSTRPRRPAAGRRTRRPPTSTTRCSTRTGDRGDRCVDSAAGGRAERPSASIDPCASPAASLDPSAAPGLVPAAVGVDRADRGPDRAADRGAHRAAHARARPRADARAVGARTGAVAAVEPAAS